jgi:hypothetical protein
MNMEFQFEGLFNTFWRLVVVFFPVVIFYKKNPFYRIERTKKSINWQTPPSGPLINQLFKTILCHRNLSFNLQLSIKRLRKQILFSTSLILIYSTTQYSRRYEIYDKFFSTYIQRLIKSWGVLGKFLPFFNNKKYCVETINNWFSAVVFYIMFDIIYILFF